MSIFAALLTTCLAIPRSDVAAAIAAYDSQITTLRALIAEPGLESMRRDASASARLTRAASANAASGVAALARSAPSPALIDPVNLEDALQAAYSREAFAVRSQAQQEDDNYAQALNAQVNAQTTALRQALAHRVDDAYAARLQLYSERENDAYVARESAVADRQVQLRIKLATLTSTDPQRRALQAQLDAIGRTLASSAGADRARDGVVLAAYRRSLEAAASSEYQTTVAELRKKAATNLTLRRAVTSAQLRATPALAIDFDAPLRAAMATGASTMFSVDASQGATAQQTEAAFTAAGNDIAQRFLQLATVDAANTASLRAQLAQMQQARATLKLRASGPVHGACF